MTKKLNIKTILRGIKPGRMQTVGNMQVIPLILDMEPDDRFASPTKLWVSNRTYGNIKVKNDEAKPTIVPAQATYLTKQRAQDHALASALFVKGYGEAQVNNAACVQSTQGGTISPEQTSLQILPFALRESAINKRKQENYGKLWQDISNFNKTLKINETSSHLEHFVQRYSDVMDQFVAEFEILNNQVGAIVLLDGIVYGVERAPNPEYWKDVWEPLIRMCYGSQAIALREKKTKTKGTIPVQVPMKIKGVKTLSALKNSLLEAESKERENAAEAVKKLAQSDFSLDQEGEMKIDDSSIVLYSAENEQFCGQVVCDGDQINYASLIIKGDWQKNRSWNEAKDFEI